MTPDEREKRRNEFRAKMIEHLEAARACADETQDGAALYMIERALDEVTSQLYPYLDPFSENWPVKRKSQP
jgi:hypothetical protein